MTIWRRASGREKRYILTKKEQENKKSLIKMWTISAVILCIGVCVVMAVTVLRQDRDDDYYRNSSSMYSSSYSSSRDYDSLNPWTYLLIFLIPTAFIDCIYTIMKKEDYQTILNGNFYVTNGQVVNKKFEGGGDRSVCSIIEFMPYGSTSKISFSCEAELFNACDLGTKVLAVQTVYDETDTPCEDDCTNVYLSSEVYAVKGTTENWEQVMMEEITKMVSKSDDYNIRTYFSRQHENEIASLREYEIMEDLEVIEDDLVYGWSTNMVNYSPVRLRGPVSGTVVVPGSKSMTNRALLLAALSNKTSWLSGVLFSDDSRHFIDSLISLGFDVVADEKEKTVKVTGCGGSIPNKSGTIDVGSAGTAARFLTAMLALSDGEYQINCSEQMEKRPMEELFRVLSEMGASFVYLKEPNHLPCIVKGNGGVCHDITMDISSSTQYLSAMLMVASSTSSGLKIDITSEKKTGAYIKITMDMLKSFGVTTLFDGNCYTVPGRQCPIVDDYYIEPDVSGACYFYGLAALSGGEIVVKNVTYNSVQGDMKFLQVLSQMGCEVTETEEGILVKGPEKLHGIDIDMNDFSDQALTLAAIAPFADSKTVIRNVGHIKGQECDRMNAIVSNLNRCGINAYSEGNDIHIFPGEVHEATIETFDDHRVAMAFTLTGLMSGNLTIKDPLCCRKTFENYYDVLELLICGLS